eukprot:3302711-Rhodomonas_salina.2
MIEAILLRDCYGMSGTESHMLLPGGCSTRAYRMRSAGTVIRSPTAARWYGLLRLRLRSAEVRAYPPTTSTSYGAAHSRPLGCYAPPTACPVLIAAMLVPGRTGRTCNGTATLRSNAPLRAPSDAAPGTGITYGPMPCVVLTYRMVLCQVRHWHRVWSYAKCGTDIAHTANVPRVRYVMCGTG